MSLIVLKALPVLVLGGFDLDPLAQSSWAAHRRLGEARRGFMSGRIWSTGGIESWSAYVVALGCPPDSSLGPLR
ncbi:MAG: hypothetical protein QM796_01615 [Chthoniobacteraceae bacterium]